MNDRTLAVLEKYDLEVLRSWKGRGAILCETKTGIKILKEYKGSPERLAIQYQMLGEIKKKGFYNIEEIILTKEGELLAKDEEMNSYYLKDYFEGKECNIRELADCCKTAEEMAKIHEAMELPDFVKEKEIMPYSLPAEFEKHNRELRHVKKYLKSKRQKNEFEYFLYQNYNMFLQKAEEILAEVEKNSEFFSEEKLKEKGITPTLAIVRCGEDPSDLSYEKGAMKRCEAAGVAVKNIVMPADVDSETFYKNIDDANHDPSIHGILMFRPVPKQLGKERARLAIAPEKDVDGCTNGSLAGVFTNTLTGFAPCTAQAVIEIFD